MTSTVVWFEIPVKDIQRAAGFYSKVMSIDMKMDDHGGTKMAVFPSHDKEAVHGALVQGEGYTPGSNGVLVYLNGGEDLSPMLARVESAGGKIVQPKVAIGPYGFCAHILDTEGNKVALHSPK